MAAPEATAAPQGENPYGIRQALEEGGIVAIATFAILVIMSAASWYILFTKLFEQQKIMNQGKRARAQFWRANSLREGAAKLEKNSAYRQIVDDGLLAQEQHLKLTDPIDQHEWMTGTLQRSTQSVNSRLGEGLALLATVGSTAPFVGLFGTVVGIYRALVKIGASGQASIDAVAGPVGEALIMTALGLIVAVPAVMAYNWLIRRNKAVMEDLNAFAAQVHGHMMSGGAIRPTAATAATGGSAPTKTPATTGQPSPSVSANPGSTVRNPTATTVGTGPTTPTTGSKTP